MYIKSANIINSNKVTKCSFDGMIASAKTAASALFLSSAIKLCNSNPSNTTREIIKLAERTGQFGLAVSALSGIICLGSILKEYA